MQCNVLAMDIAAKPSAFISPVLPQNVSKPRAMSFGKRRKWQYIVSASAPAQAASTRVRFPQLRATRFQHPIDIQATRALRRLSVLEPVLRAALVAAESAMILDGLATGVQVTEKQLPHIHNMLVQACRVLDMPVPDLYIKQSPVPNAYTLAVQGKRPFIVVHSALLELLDNDEVQAVLAHECGHLKAEHGLWVTMANLVILLSSGLVGRGLGRALAEIGNAQIMRWLRAAELTCDRAALLVVQDPVVVMSTVMKLAGGSPKYAKELDIESYLAQADQFEKASATRLGRLLSKGMVQGLTHPLPVLRVRELKRWSRSNHFQTLVNQGQPITEA